MRFASSPIAWSVWNVSSASRCLAAPVQRTTTIDVGGILVTVTRVGAGRPVLVLHGGGGPLTVLPWGTGLAAARNAEVIVPVHPGFNGTPRPEPLRTPGGLAELYVRMLDTLGLEGVTVVGSSIGGWIAAEIVMLSSVRVSGVVLVDAVGLVEAPPEVQAAMAGNRGTPGVYGGDMTDPTLAGRLPGVNVPVVVVWGAADRIGDLEVGEAYAELVPGARLEVISDAGHLPQIETPTRLEQVPGAQLTVLANTGHQLFTDQPEAGAATVLDFLRDVDRGA